MSNVPAKSIRYNAQIDGMPPTLTGDHTLDDYVVVPDFGPQVVSRMPEIVWEGKTLPQKVFCFRHGWEIEDDLIPAEPEEEDHAEA